MLLFAILYGTVVTGTMPKTPRKNTTPRKLLRLPAAEIQDTESASSPVKMTGFSSEDNLPTAVAEDSKCELAAVNSSQLQVISLVTAAEVKVESTAQEEASANNHHQSTKRTSPASPEGNTETTEKIAVRRSKRLSTRQKKVSSKSPEVATEDGVICLQTDKPLTEDSSVELHCTSISDERVAMSLSDEERIGESVDLNHSLCSYEMTMPTRTSSAADCNIVITTDSRCEMEINTQNKTAAELPSGDIMMLASAACSTNSNKTTEVEESVLASHFASPDEPESVLPTPQKNQLRMLSEELSLLSQESGHITTRNHRRSGTTPRRGQNHASGNRQSRSTPRRFNVLSLGATAKSNSRSPGSTPRKTDRSPRTPWRVKFPFSATPSKSNKKATKTSSSTKKSPCSSSVLHFPTPSKKQTKRKLYLESPESDARKPSKVSRYVLIVCNKILKLSNNLHSSC